MGELGIFDGCPEDIWLVFCRYLTGVLNIYVGSPVYIWWVSWIYLMGVLEIFEVCVGDIW